MPNGMADLLDKSQNNGKGYGLSLGLARLDQGIKEPLLAWVVGCQFLRVPLNAYGKGLAAVGPASYFHCLYHVVWSARRDGQMGGQSVESLVMQAIHWQGSLPKDPGQGGSWIHRDRVRPMMAWMLRMPGVLQRVRYLVLNVLVEAATQGDIQDLDASANG
jgi:hypothetical protein